MIRLISFIITSLLVQELRAQDSRPCVDSVIVSLPFYHESELDESMGDDWEFENEWNDGVDFAYEITLLDTKNIYVDTCDPITDFDTILSIKDACGNTVSLTEFDDGTQDFCPEASVEPPYFASIIDSFRLDPGTYYIVVDGYGGNIGNYKVAMGTLPEIIGSTIASDDSYLELYFSEGMYTDATGNGAMVVSDFELTFDQGAGTATDVTIDYISSVSGNPLVGGEDTVRFYINVEGESTGLEQVTIQAFDNASIFNSFGIGLLRSASRTQNLSDQLIPVLVSTNPVDGATEISTFTNIELEFSEPVQNNSGLEINNANATSSILLLNTDTDQEIDYSITSENNVNFTIDPDNDLPDYAYINLIISNIQDTNGNIFVDDSIQFRTADESPPLIQSSNMASTNQYVSITFSEGVYSTASELGGLEIGDLEYEFDPDGGNCISLSIVELTNPTGAPLTGGETTIHAFLQLGSAPSGSEYVIFSPVNGSSIYDLAGNGMFPNNETDTLLLNGSAQIIGNVLDDDNSFVDIIFSDGIYGNAFQSESIGATDLQVLLETNGGNATAVDVISLTSILGNSLGGGEDTIRINLSFNNLPSGLENIIINPAGEDRIYTSSGVLIPQSETTGQIILNDQLPPSGESNTEDGAVNVDQDNVISLTFTDSLYNPETGELYTIPELGEYIILRSPDADGEDITFTLSLSGEPPVLSIIPQDNFESEADIFFSFSADIADSNGNSIQFNYEALFTIEDYIIPFVESLELDLNNAFIDLYFNDQIYGDDDATGIIEIADIIVSINPNGSQADSCWITSLTKIDNNFLIGGESSIRVNLDYNYTPNGNETIILDPIDNISLFDDAANQYSTDSSFTGLLNLNDNLPPSITNVSLSLDSWVLLMQDNPIKFYFNEQIKDMAFTVTSSVLDEINFSSTPFDILDSSIVCTLKPEFASHDSITVNFSYLEDNSGNNNVDIAFTYRTPMLGDYDLDSAITYHDLDTLFNNWGDLDYQLGPVKENSSVPHLVSELDSVFDLDDGMAFMQMWSWYQQQYGEIIKDTSMVGRPVEMNRFGNQIDIIISDTITSGQVKVIFFDQTQAINLIKTPSGVGKMFLTKHFPHKGFSVIEFTRKGILSRDTINLMFYEDALDFDLFYEFVDGNNDIVQRRIFNFENRIVPMKLELHPAYPNPFNPTTTLRFDIPITDKLKSSSLDIYDVRGRLVESLASGTRLPGNYKVSWNADRFSSGVYFARLIHGKDLKTTKVILLK